MITQLVRTRFESNMMSFIVFVALIVAGAARFLMTREPVQGPEQFEQIQIATAWLMLCCLAAGIVSLLRQNRERSGRLYAQLPASARQIRASYWLHVCLYPGVAALLLHAVLLFGGSEPVDAAFQVVSAGFFLSTILWLACLSLVTSNIARVIPHMIRANIVLYSIVVALATLLLGYSLILVVVFLGGAGVAALPYLFTLVALICATLVALDIHLYAKKDLAFD